MKYFHTIQCKDKISNKIGCFVYCDNKPFEAVSPVFGDYYDLLIWMKGKFENCNYGEDRREQFQPFRVKKID